jgi:cytochrome c oxidase subunit 1
VFGVFVIGFSSILTGINFIVTIHKLRPAGMTWFRIPLFLWGLYATAIIQIIATPVLGITLLLLILERLFHLGIFNSYYGGDPILFQHFFWFYSHPAVYIMILPAMGIMSEVIPTFSRREIFGYKYIAMSSVAIAVIGFLVWGHHMFPNGQSGPLNAIFSAMTMLVAIPSGVKIWNWLATMYKGSIVLKTPMCYALCFFFLFAIGGLTGLFLATLAVNFHVHDTYFVVAHFHYVMIGGALFMFIGGIHYWWPKITGRMYNETFARACCLLQFVGFNLTFFPQFVMGTHGMPRRYATYPPEFQPYHVLSSIGAFTQMTALLLIAAYLIYSLYRGRRAPSNPWGGSTLEWTCASPPPYDNFPAPPSVGEPYDHSNLVWSETEKGYQRV